jgi:flagellar biosynthesis/type III secretory pathway protein FliH
MRSPTGSDAAVECRVRFDRPLRGASVLPPGAPLPELKPARRTAPAPAAQTPPQAAERKPEPDTAREAALAAERAADRAHLRGALEQARAAVAELHAGRSAQVAELQRAAVEMAATIAARLLHDTVTAGEFPIDAKVRDMIAQLDTDAPVTVRLNPADLQLLKQRLAGDPLLADRADPRFVPGPELARGACRVEAGETTLASDLAAELELIREDLIRSLGDAQS